MDQYVGETEKHLAQLLAGARENRCVLLFDEADALFSRRAQVSGGHDKYANLSTAYLLQEIEQYEGVALLSTNLLGSFDDAFLRRLQYIIRFPQPDAALREQLWQRSLPAVRLCGDIPYAALAQAEPGPHSRMYPQRGSHSTARGQQNAGCILPYPRPPAGAGKGQPLPAARFFKRRLNVPARVAPEGRALWAPAIFSRKID